MADIAPTPFINYGLSQSQQADAQASAAVKTQQAQGAAMQNQIMAAKLPFIMRMYEQMGAQSDASGMDTQGQPGGPLAARAAMVDEHGYDPEQLSASNRSRYTVPEWTPQEQNDFQNAPWIGPEAVAWSATRRQQRLDMMRQRSAFDASNQFDKYNAAATAPSTLEYLKQADKPYYNYLQQFKQTHPDADLEKMAKGYAEYQSADLHRFTGRKVDFKNGVAVDGEYGTPVAGVAKLPMDPKDQAALIADAQKPTVEVQTGIPGQTKKIAPWQAAGYQSVHDYVNALAQGLAPTPEQINARLAGRPLTATDLANFRQQSRTAPGGTPAPTASTPKPVAAAAPPASDSQAATPPPAVQQPQSAATAATAATPAAPAAPFTGREGLSEVNADKLPKYQPPQNPPNVGASTEQNLDIAAHNREKYAQMQASNVALQKSATERGLLDQAQAEVNNLRNNPRAVGPGSAVTTAYNEFLAYATGKAPDPLVERKMFDKVLLQLGAANVKAAFDNQSRIGQQEYMKLLTEGNPTGEMPLDAVQKLVNFARYNNEFDTRMHNTRLDALNRGADPYSREFNNLGQGRAAFVQEKMGGEKKDPYEIGRLYPGANNTRARYKGNGQWAPE